MSNASKRRKCEAKEVDEETFQKVLWKNAIFIAEGVEKEIDSFLSVEQSSAYSHFSKEQNEAMVSSDVLDCIAKYRSFESEEFMQTFAGKLMLLAENGVYMPLDVDFIEVCYVATKEEMETVEY